ncbi:MAG TPA: hypothetical protein VK870_02245 [Ignavibacteriaceae bacterium]|nr:hypothetical protein [Ignavibacteriaceae bacterium]
MNSFPTILEKYIKKNHYSNWLIEPTPNKLYNCIIVIPALAELENIKKLLLSLSENEATYFNDTLILFVVNNTISASEDIKLNNQRSLKFLNNLLSEHLTDTLSKSIVFSGLQVAFIDASSVGKEMNDKDGGVGLARKIGMDTALKYFDYSGNSKKILVCLDADCTVEKNYINAIIEYFQKESCKAAVVNYGHNIDGANENTAAIICYELFLRYYLMGLQYAGSPYAFHTIGSTMVCDYESYIKIGGMNKLKAAEDFYFLEKLSKITKVHSIKSTSVYPSSRPSFRVPFGTGQRVNRFLAKVRNEYILYNPQSFVILKKWLHLFESLNEMNMDHILNEVKIIDTDLFQFLSINKFEQFWEKICLQELKDQQIIKQKKFWFDAFKTLKLIHYLRDNHHPAINMFDAIDDLLELCGVTDRVKRSESILLDLDNQKEYLLLLRKLQNN